MELSHDTQAVRVSEAEREIALTRRFDAPREQVFDCWFDPVHISNWWGPVGFTTTTHEMDATPGGTWRFTMHGPDGRDYANKVVYEEIVRPERLVYRHFGEADNEGLRFRVTVTFAAVDGKTEMDFRMVFDTVEMHQDAARSGAIEGLQDTLARLEEYLA